MNGPGRLWTIVLAAGEGRRLRPLTRALHGENLPKQFAMIHGDRSLLQSTLARVARWSAPERTLVVAARDRERLARSHLRAHDSIQIVVQPRDRGTGAGVLLPLVRIAVQEPTARVAIVPSDHFVRDTSALVASVRHAEEAAIAGDSIVLLGAVPDRAETEYGWIVPNPTPIHPSSGSFSVLRFHEKPSARIARKLVEEGALWNTFLMVGSVERFLALAARHLPEHHPLFENYRDAIGTDSESKTLSRIYDGMDTVDFSRQVLEENDGLVVVPLKPCGWSDWGTPARVFASLQGTPDLEALRCRLRKRRESVATRFERFPDEASRFRAERELGEETLTAIGGSPT